MDAHFSIKKDKTALVCDLPTDHKNVYHVFGTSESGICKKTYDKLRGGTFEQMAKKLFFDPPFPNVLLPKQVHGSDIYVCGAGSESLAFGIEADGLITDIRGMGLAIATADCLPVFLISNTIGVVGAFHAGWRGTVKNIILKGLELFEERFGVKPSDITAVLGPSIGKCCFEVGSDVVLEILDAGITGSCITGISAGRGMFDLAEANRLQLLSAGCRAESIFSANICTKCRQDIFHSYRGQGEAAGRMLNLIGLC